MAEPENAESMLDDIGALARGAERVSIGDVVERIGARGFGPLIFVPALVGASPLGGLPGVPTLMALVIVLIAVQILVRRGRIWLPGPLRRRGVTSQRLQGAIERARPAARGIDRWLGRKLDPLTSAPARVLAALIVICLCVLVPPLELVPFAALAPMLAIALIGLAIAAQDGILMLVGLGGAGGALITALNLLI